MPQITVDFPFEKIVDTIKQLNEEEQERLFFAVNEDYAKALSQMKDEAWKEHQKGKSTSLEPSISLIPRGKTTRNQRD